MELRQYLEKQKLQQLIDTMPETSIRVSMVLNGLSDNLSLVRRIIFACVQHLGLNSALLNDIKLATTEACTNVIKHAYDFDTEKTFDLKMGVSEDLFVIEVTYDDPAFVPNDIPTPNLKEIKEGGLGVFIIRNVMDAVEYATDPKTGKVVLCMIKKLNSKTVSGG